MYSLQQHCHGPGSVAQCSVFFGLLRSVQHCFVFHFEISFKAV